jgi:hypothetical protein
MVVESSEQSRKIPVDTAEGNLETDLAARRRLGVTAASTGRTPLARLAAARFD